MQLAPKALNDLAVLRLLGHELQGGSLNIQRISYGAVAGVVGNLGDVVSGLFNEP
jgi:hypothetical protein